MDKIVANVIPNMKAVDLGDGTFGYAVVSEDALDRGIATGGSGTTLADTTKNWIVNDWAGDILEVVIGGIEYHRLIGSNTATVITMAALPGIIVVAAGNPYKIKDIGGTVVTIADGADVAQGSIADAVVVAGAVGTLSAKLRAISRDIGASLVAGAITGAHTAPVIAAATTLALAANANRNYALFANDGDETIYLGIGVAAVMNIGVPILSGGSYEMSRQIGNLDVRIVNAICASGGQVLAVTEGV